ncbi:MAG TPA: OpgC domain-containing protein [Dongiaceae bacterium]|nr:OpgC domain-containing protein [Dongiaceae bacterium]
MSKTLEAVKKVSERIVTFDLMRGYFLFVILLNHLEFYPDGLSLLTGESLLYVSTAEGFFVVSGIVLGIIRGRKLIDQPFHKAAKLLWKRAFQLYLTSITLTIIFTLVGQLFLQNTGLKYGIYTDWSHWWTFMWQTVTLNYDYGWADFLRYYAVFLLFAPFVLWLLRKGKWYIGAILSVIVWSLYPLLPDSNPYAELMSWQILFFGGFTIGFYWQDILAKWRTLSLKTRKAIGLSFFITFIVTGLTCYALVFGHKLGGTIGPQIDAIHHIVEQGFNKDRLPLPRILLGTVWFWGLFYLVRRFESKIKKYLGWLLLNFGTNSLYVYTISAFVVFAIQLFVAPPGFGNVFLNLLTGAAATALVLLCVKTRFLMHIIPR